jgi:hypothetical protein
MSLAAIAASQKMDPHQLGRLVKLSWLSPSIIEHIHTGDIPRALARSRLLEADLPLDWGEQERARLLLSASSLASPQHQVPIKKQSFITHLQPTAGLRRMH